MSTSSDATEFKVVNNTRRRNNKSSGNDQRRKRASNRRLISVLLERYEHMVTRRFGSDVASRVDLNNLLVDCFKYDLNQVLNMSLPYTHLDELVKTEIPREERLAQQQSSSTTDVVEGSSE